MSKVSAIASLGPPGLTVRICYLYDLIIYTFIARKPNYIN